MEDSDLYRVYMVRQGKKFKQRLIQQPNENLMQFQKNLVKFFELYPLLDCCFSKKGMSIKDNADAHSKAKYVLRVDIKNCYPSITRYHIEQGLNLVDEIYFRSASYRLLDYCLYDDGRDMILPTGSPTSPILCNIALTPLDLQIQELAEQYGYTYTRYMDDLHLSTTNNKRHWDLINQIKQLIKDYNLQVNNKKSQWYTVNNNDKVIITGVRVKNGCTAPRSFVRTVRARLQNLAKDKLPIDKETQGCLSYIYSIDPERYNSLLQYYDRRLNYEPTQRECLNS